MLGQMQKMISRYGTAMTLVSGGTETEIRAFLQESRSKSQENSRREFTPVGETQRGLYVYIGPARPAAVEGDLLILQGRRFEFRRAEPVTVGDETAYCWGLCIEKGGGEAWDS